MYVGIVLWAFNLFYSVGMDSNPAHGIIFSYAIYLCFGIPPYFIGAYHRLIFRLAQNDLLSHDEASSGHCYHREHAYNSVTSLAGLTGRNSYIK